MYIWKYAIFSIEISSKFWWVPELNNTMVSSFAQKKSILFFKFKLWFQNDFGRPFHLCFKPISLTIQTNLNFRFHTHFGSTVCNEGCWYACSIVPKRRRKRKRTKNYTWRQCRRSKWSSHRTNDVTRIVSVLLKSYYPFNNNTYTRE